MKAAIEENIAGELQMTSRRNLSGAALVMTTCLYSGSPHELALHDNH